MNKKDFISIAIIAVLIIPFFNIGSITTAKSESVNVPYITMDMETKYSYGQDQRYDEQQRQYDEHQRREEQRQYEEQQRQYEKEQRREEQRRQMYGAGGMGKGGCCTPCYLTNCLLRIVYQVVHWVL